MALRKAAFPFKGHIGGIQSQSYDFLTYRLYYKVATNEVNLR